MITSINYLSSNAVGTSAATVGSGSQSPLVSSQSTGGGVVAQLSALGQVKFSLTDLQNKARALNSISRAPTLGDLKVVVHGFVQSFNSLNSAVKGLTAKQGTLTTNSRLGQTLNDVRKAVNGDDRSTFASLQKLGISQQAGGAFSINQKQLEKSFRDNQSGVLSAVSDISSRITLVTGQQPPADGVIGKNVNDLSVRATELGDNSSKAQDNLNTQERPQQVPAVKLTNAGDNAVSAYAGVASL